MATSADCYVVSEPNGTIGGYRLSDGRRLWVIKHSEPQARLTISRDGRFMAIINDRGTEVWHIEGSQPHAIWEAAGSQFFTFAPDCEHVAYSIPNDGMRLVRIGTGQIVRTIGNGSARSKFSFDTLTSRIAVCGAAGVQVIAGDTGEVEVEFPQEYTVDPLVTWHPGGEYLVAWTDTKGIALWNLKSRVKKYTFPHVGIPARVSFNEDGSILATQSLWNQRLMAWDVGTAQLLLEVPEFNSQACDVGPDGRIMFLTLQDDAIVESELTPGTAWRWLRCCTRRRDTGPKCP